MAKVKDRSRDTARAAKALLRAGRIGEARALLGDAAEKGGGGHSLIGKSLLAEGRLDDAVDAFTRAVEKDPSWKTRRDLAATRRFRDLEPCPVRPSVWPNRLSQWDDFAEICRRHVLADTAPEPGLLTLSTRVVTMGSCFAEHIAEELQARGLDVFYMRFAEDINTPYANLRLTRWAAGAEADDHLEEIFGADERADMLASLRACDLFIFSAGVAAGFYDRTTGEPVLWLGGPAENAFVPAYHAYRTPAPTESADYIRQTIEVLRRLNPAVQVVLTVSPVPLGGTFERRSPFVADCLSKASLRLAVEEVMAQNSGGIRYWPSFKIVRWAAAHVADRRPYGEDDRETRHVSAWLRSLIMQLFVEQYGDAELSGSPHSALVE